MFFKKKPPLNSEEYNKLSNRISMIEIDISLIIDKLDKAIKRKVIKKTEEPEEDKYKSEQILPM